MQQNPGHTKLALLFFLSVGLSTVLAGVFGAPILRVIHLVYGRLRFWILLPLAGVGLWVGDLVPQGLSLLVGVAAVGVYRELEAQKVSWLKTGLLSLVAGLTVAAIGLWVWSYQEGWVLLDQAKLIIQKFMSEAGPLFASSEAGEEVTLNLLVAQLPSLLAILVLVGLALSLVFERTVLAVFGLMALEPRRVQYRLRDFKVPDFLVWVSLVAFLVTVVDFGWAPLKAVGANALNVMVILYFFQGLAIVESFLRFYGVGWIWRFLTYTLLVIQLFFLPMLLGFVDFWFGFRERLKKKEPKVK